MDLLQNKCYFINKYPENNHIYGVFRFFLGVRKVDWLLCQLK